ncbi:MAG: 2-amino-4-hydroxy-6-hydroxymethyldihydropteridine diphosphokinase [Hyphomonadaceae bacterium]|nr:2-amino-4-hydroxy-6-hydroxymethyldihydropteridine diphosphokinase [Hyphomonadaceae bacterium]
MIEVGIGLGSNLDDRCGNIIAALKALNSIPSIMVTRVSSIYATPPWGVEDQPEFLNAAALIRTSLSPSMLLDTCKAIERSLGRALGRRWGPREIDIDLLFFGDLQISSDDLVLPHLNLFERLFVLIPLNEIMDGRRVARRDLKDAILQLSGIDPPSEIRLDREATERLKDAI